MCNALEKSIENRSPHDGILLRNPVFWIAPGNQMNGSDRFRCKRSKKHDEG